MHADGAVDVKFEDGDFKRNLRGIELRDIGHHRDSSSSPQRKGRRQRPSSAKPLPSGGRNGDTNTGKQPGKPKRPSSAPRARNSSSGMPVGGGLTFAQWKRNSSKSLYSGGSAKTSTTRLSGARKIPLARRPKTGSSRKKMPQDLAKYLSTKVNPILRNLSEKIFLDQPHDLATYISDFAAEISAKQYGSCGDVVRRLAAAVSSTRTAEGDNTAVTALSFFRAEDADATGVLTFSNFARALEEMENTCGATLTGEEMGRLFSDFDAGNGRGIKYEDLASLIDGASMTVSVLLF